MGIHMIDADVDDLWRRVVRASAFAGIALILCDNQCCICVRRARACLLISANSMITKYLDYG